MILFKKLKWSNTFSYGETNELDLSKDKVTQLIGANGNGKSSIAWILEEVLFNKNSKGRKKESILNWNSGAKYYYIELTFSVDYDEYTVIVKRSGTQTVTLLKNDEDISSHTATNTFKQIESILGYTQKTFSQIACQTHSSSLEFLTSPDTARKKFLIDLIDLNQYIAIGDILKKISVDLNKDLANINGKISTIEGWIESNNKIDKTKKEFIPIPTMNHDLLKERDSLVVEISNVESLNLKIRNNNVYLQELNNLVSNVDIPNKPEDTRNQLISKKAELNKVIVDAKNLKSKIEGLSSTCPTCLQDITNKFKDDLLQEQRSIIDNTTVDLNKISDNLLLVQEQFKQWEQAIKVQTEIERLHALIDKTIPTEPVNKQDLLDKLSIIDSQIENITSEIKKIENINKNVEIHNNKIDIIISQLEAYTKELLEHNNKLSSINSRISRINILVKAFSTTGLVAYKLEAITNELEALVNYYLVELSNGQFQLEFQLSGSDKLDVLISNNGKQTDISSLSAGETTRVNIAVLLAIRKLMQQLTGSSINILFLDEAISTLDIDGKEKLVQVLLDEEYLNTILVSHEFQHPLITNIHVIKENNISKLIKE